MFPTAVSSCWHNPHSPGIAWLTLHKQMYIRENAEGNADIQRMKSAVWVDLVSALLWLFTAVAALGYWWRHRERHSRFTGRAKV